MCIVSQYFILSAINKHPHNGWVRAWDWRTFMYHHSQWAHNPRIVSPSVFAPPLALKSPGMFARHRDSREPTWGANLGICILNKLLRWFLSMLQILKPFALEWLPSQGSFSILNVNTKVINKESKIRYIWDRAKVIKRKKNVIFGDLQKTEE